MIQTPDYGRALRLLRCVLRMATLTAFGGALCAAVAQDASKFPCPESEIAHYTAYQVRQTIRVDGRLDEKAWLAVPRSPRFIDVLTGQPTLFDTHAAVLWDAQNLYVAYWVEEPNVAATLTQRNAPIYENNDVELFIAGKDAYYEFEINALNTIYEVFFMWEDTYEKTGYSKVPQFQRSNPKVRPFNGVGFTTHPRGPRLGSWDWQFPGLKSAVGVQGSLNNPKDKDRGWTVELAFPWEGMTWLAKGDGRALPPQGGDVWRMDFSRFNQYKAPAPAQDSGGWFWSRHGVWDSHIPECFPYIRFSSNDVFFPKSK
jgi:hypothetical protein